MNITYAKRWLSKQRNHKSVRHLFLWVAGLDAPKHERRNDQLGLQKDLVGCTSQGAHASDPLRRAAFKGDTVVT